MTIKFLNFSCKLWIPFFFFYANFAYSQASNCPTPVRMQAQPQGGVHAVLRFTGDLVLGNAHAVENIPKEWESEYFAGVEDYLRLADATIGNLEGAMTDFNQSSKQSIPGRSYAFRYPPSYGPLLKKVGFQALHIANNHSGDFGERGFSDTLEHLNNAQIVPIGIKGEIAYITIKGLKIGLVGFGFYQRNNTIHDLVTASKLVAKAREQSSYVIATFHGGGEGDAFVVQPNKDEIFLNENRGNSVAFARAVIDSGADLVVGHGPHVLRSVECYKGKPIFYSLGNFISVGGLSIRNLASVTAIAGVQLNYKSQLVGIEFLPLVFNERKVPKIDDRDFASHLINSLANKALYAGDFLKMPASVDNEAAFTSWFNTIVKTPHKP